MSGCCLLEPYCFLKGNGGIIDLGEREGREVLEMVGEETVFGLYHMREESIRINKDRSAKTETDAQILVISILR